MPVTSRHAHRTPGLVPSELGWILPLLECEVRLWDFRKQPSPEGKPHRLKQPRRWSESHFCLAAESSLPPSLPPEEVVL